MSEVQIRLPEGRHPRDKHLRSDRIPHIWCPGCGLGNALTAFGRAIEKVDIPYEDHVLVAGIGCSARSVGYIDLDSYHTTHGRAIGFATGVKVARPELSVTVFSGDGDLFSIGGNHFIHAARRNLDMTVLVINNFNYGMTGGQSAATTPTDAYTTTSPYGNVERSFNLPALADALGVTYISRWTTMHVPQLADAIAGAFEHKGFAFVEIISPCQPGYGKRNKLKSANEEMDIFRRDSVIDHDADLNSAGVNLLKSGPITVGNFKDAPELTWHDNYEDMREKVTAPKEGRK